MADVHFTTAEKLSNKLAKVAADNNLAFEKGEIEILTRRLENAYDIILGALLVRGLTAAQVNTWARGEEFQLDLATYWYGRDAAWGTKTGDEQDWVKHFDRTKELDTVPIVNTSGTLLSSSGKVAAEGVNLLDVNAALGVVP